MPDLDLDRYEREQAAFDRLQPNEKLLVNASRNTDRLLSELRAIRWALFVLVALAVMALFIFGPKGWWHTPFWQYA